ncbi:MAG TPA: hypothetical protein VKV74_06135 [Bryobacteraceae bacterium]|nr:hypothetical protein [Bryobacteraceae bacterium]
MTTNEKNYLNRGKGDARVPTGAENEAWIPTPFADEDINPDYDQTMSALDEALEAATCGGEVPEVDDSYEGASDAPGEPS